MGRVRVAIRMNVGRGDDLGTIGAEVGDFVVEEKRGWGVGCDVLCLHDRVSKQVSLVGVPASHWPGFGMLRNLS